MIRRDSHNNILCPRCSRPMSLAGFKLTEHRDGTLTVTPGVECPHDCGACFCVTRSEVEWMEDGVKVVEAGDTD